MDETKSTNQEGESERMRELSQELEEVGKKATQEIKARQSQQTVPDTGQSVQSQPEVIGPSTTVPTSTLVPKPKTEVSQTPASMGEVTSQESPPPPTEKPKSKLVLFLGLALLTTALLTVAGYFFLSSRKSEGTSDLSPTLIARDMEPTEIPTPTPDPTAGWKDHSSNRVSFKYPESLTLEERQNNYFVLLSNPNNPQSVMVSIDARLTGNYTNYDNAVTSTKEGLTNVQVQEMDNGIKMSGEVGPGYGEGQKITIVLFRYQQGAIEVETTSTDPTQLQIFDQILSTFQFIEIEVTPSLPPTSSPSAQMQ
jgi:hypothetical protein